MAMLAMAFPIPAGKTEQWKKFISELTGARKAEFAASRRSLGVRERTFLQQTPHGDMVLVTLEGDYPETAFAEFGKQTDPFAVWFKQQVREIHGMDLSAPPPGPHAAAGDRFSLMTKTRLLVSSCWRRRCSRDGVGAAPRCLFEARYTAGAEPAEIRLIADATR
jgi:hypothetical protein